MRLETTLLFPQVGGHNFCFIHEILKCQNRYIFLRTKKNVLYFQHQFQDPKTPIKTKKHQQKLLPAGPGAQPEAGIPSITRGRKVCKC